MSRATLVRRFKDAVGLAPMSYLANWRLMKAYSLIKYSTTPFEAIADTVGFASSQSLSKAFQRAYGRAPRDLRNSQKTAKDDIAQ